MEPHRFSERYPQDDGICSICGLTIYNDCHHLSLEYLEELPDIPDAPEGMPELDTNQNVPEQRITGKVKLSDLPMIAGVVNTVEELKARSIGIPWEVYHALKFAELNVDKCTYHVDSHEDYLEHGKRNIVITIMETPKDVI